ncbi:hypothetical protein ATANTOWER_002734, partial [Ataeniobius toweri]|nr:hypothetical protein [Ataeniobius toweri]
AFTNCYKQWGLSGRSAVEQKCFYLIPEFLCCTWLSHPLAFMNIRAGKQEEKRATKEPTERPWDSEPNICTKL